MSLDPRAWLEEDHAFDDATTRATVPEEARARAEVVAKQELVLSGLRPATAVFEETGCRVEAPAIDGDRARAGDVLLRVEGPARSVLTAERVALNLLGHLSGIATATAAVVDRVRSVNPACKVLATRKTTPGLRALEHAAVEHGGGAPHREDLASALLVKENHLALVTIEEAVERARAEAAGLFLMVEAETLDEAQRVARAGADGVLLDNFSADALEDVVELLKHVKPDLVVEASGNLTMENVADHAVHVDRVSLGSITHSAPVADVSLRLEPVRN